MRRRLIASVIAVLALIFMGALVYQMSKAPPPTEDFLMPCEGRKAC